MERKHTACLQKRSLVPIKIVPDLVWRRTRQHLDMRLGYTRLERIVLLEYTRTEVSTISQILETLVEN